MLLLWPDAASRDEYNEPLEAFSDATEAKGRRVGRGWIVRFGERHGTLWWDHTRQACEAAGSWWANDFDVEHRKAVTDPLLKLARIERPVTATFPAVIADALVSDRGVAVPLVNLRGVQDEHGARYLNLEVTLTRGKDVTRAYSSRHGALPLRRDGDAVGVVMPLDVTDVLIFAKQ